MHAGSNLGFIPGAFLFFRSLEHDGDYHRSVDATVFEKWFTEQLLPNILPNSVIVMDNASYHSRRSESYPLSTWKKEELLRWLTEKRVKIPEMPLRSELWSLAKEQRRRYQDYICDTLAEEAGHTVLRLPPYHSELNPIELIWSQVKGRVAKSNTTYRLDDVKNF